MPCQIIFQKIGNTLKIGEGIEEKTAKLEPQQSTQKLPIGDHGDSMQVKREKDDFIVIRFYNARPPKKPLVVRVSYDGKFMLEENRCVVLENYKEKKGKFPSEMQLVKTLELSIQARV